MIIIRRIALLLLLGLCIPLKAQIEDPAVHTAILIDVFRDIEVGFNRGDVSEFSKYLDSRTYLSLSNGISGFYSSNQSFYILKDFLKDFSAFNFRFTNKAELPPSPFGSGLLRFNFRGVRKSSLVFISLKRDDEGWKISQITIN
ncbi:MAG: DUF4783 domain-containing protein [Melioribacteraceae bacterium]|nr:DUF4783 domain-containing protein [Melioribacteraceae bacterium]MCF8355807.1 DUF4783 domain-containing protein [Melioribacteraceae bacterium]MCF8395297.1 DUF4783 domain-containing protein [Melioribacteraceae bacterium]MCF8420745.1 DUF4783 domain-containing protein [Melioribacteraceae bacterium]